MYHDNDRYQAHGTHSKILYDCVAVAVRNVWSRNRVQ